MAAPEDLLEGLRCLGRLLAEWPRGVALVGGLAMIARVLPRSTDDIDLVMTLPAESVTAFLDLAARHGFMHDPEETRAAIEGGLLHLFLPPSQEEGLGMDVIIADDVFLERVVARATPVDLGVCTVPVATVEDLLLLKLEANRVEDIDDILSIKDACASTLDMAYVRAEAERLSIVSALDLYFSAAT